MTGLVARLLKGATNYLRLACFFNEHADPWSRLEMRVSGRSFGLASHHDFGLYLEGPSRVPTKTLADLCAWLRECEAIDDQTLFQQPDHWQHPASFENLRKGDCEDHALWAWRQLNQLEVPALFVAGLWGDIPHTWVLFQHNGSEYLLETTAKTGEMMHSVEAARHFYCPALAVDRHCRTYVYQGYPRFRVRMGHQAGGA